MSVHHVGYNGNGLEEYVCRRTFPSGTTVTQLWEAVDEMRRELFAHREGMEVEASNKAQVTVASALNIGYVAVTIRGWWLDAEALGRR